VRIEQDCPRKHATHFSPRKQIARVRTMLDQEDRRADARSAAETAQFEPGADRGGWPDVAVPRDREQRSRRNPDVAIRRSSADVPSRKGRNSRRPVISALTMVCLLLAGAGSYL